MTRKADFPMHLNVLYALRKVTKRLDDFHVFTLLYFISELQDKVQYNFLLLTVNVQFCYVTTNIHFCSVKNRYVHMMVKTT